MGTPIFDKNLEKLKPADHIDSIVVYDGSKIVTSIDQTKKASKRIYANLLGFEDGTLSEADLSAGTELFAEHTIDQLANPSLNKHPNIQVLLDARNSGATLRGVINFSIPSDLEGRVRELQEVKKANKISEKRAEALEAFGQVADLLERGYLRVAKYTENGWQVADWVKQALMFGFLGQNISYGGQLIDKETLPLRSIGVDSGARIVPPAAGLRRSAYVGTGTTFMPPAYVNIGAFVGRKTMVENLVGSCAQVGKESHISAGAVIGGVLDPIEATPVILGDYVLMGEGSGVTQGTRLGDLVTLAPGVHISKATPVIDPFNGVAYTARGTQKLVRHSEVPRLFTVSEEFTFEKSPSYGPEVPTGALVVPGIFVCRSGQLRVAPTIAKYITSTDQRAYTLNDDLRQ